MATAPSSFDCADIYKEHSYLVRLTKGRSGIAQIFEVYGRLPTDRETQWAPETVLRCEVNRKVWDAISAEVRAEFNNRLKADGKKAGRWGAAETALQRLLGKELLVLLWAIESPDLVSEEIGVAIRNWAGLKPEERWWLYTMTAATTGLAHQVGLGWRSALRKALCFGTRSDAFNLGAVAGRGTLPPRTNVIAGEETSSANAKKRKSKSTTEATEATKAATSKKRASKAGEPKREKAPETAKPAAETKQPNTKRKRAGAKPQPSFFDLPAAAE
jgi:hypothetical protein